jgi:hypothetical protein
MHILVVRKQLKICRFGEEDTLEDSGQMMDLVISIDI